MKDRKDLSFFVREGGRREKLRRGSHRRFGHRSEEASSRAAPLLTGAIHGWCSCSQGSLKATKGVGWCASCCTDVQKDVTPPGPVLSLLTLMSYILPEAKLFPLQDLGDLAFREPQKRKLAEFNVISYADQMRLRTAIELIKATRDIESQLEKVSSPLLILHGAADRVTDPKVSRYLYEKASTEDKTLKLYEESYHSILEGEPDERIVSVISDIISWLDSHSSID